MIKVAVKAKPYSYVNLLENHEPLKRISLTSILTKNMALDLHRRFVEKAYDLGALQEAAAIEFVEYGAGVGDADLSVEVRIYGPRPDDWMQRPTWETVKDIVDEWLTGNRYSLPDSYSVTIDWPGFGFVLPITSQAMAS